MSKMLILLNFVLQIPSNGQKPPTRSLKCAGLPHTVVPDRFSSHLHFKFGFFSTLGKGFVVVLSHFTPD